MRSSVGLTAIVFLASVSVACTTIPLGPLPPQVPGPDITIIVDDSSDHTRTVHSVAVSAVLASGEIRQVGHVVDGRVTLSKRRLQELGTKVLLFDGDLYFCGAIRVFDPADRFYAYDEYHIALAPFHIH